LERTLPHPPEQFDSLVPEEVDAVRLDTWLDVACLFRTRSEAQKACNSGKVEVNGDTAKPHRLLRPEDAIEISRPYGRKQQIVVKVLVGRHLPKAEARKLYLDLTPPPTAAEIEMRRIERLYRAATTPVRPSDRRERRRVRKMKEGG
jgi:ribosome-associated heat shock protein Hsp15